MNMEKGQSDERFKLFGFIYFMMMLTHRRVGGPIDQERNCRDNYIELQRAFFTNYGHQWGMKNQGVLLPNGMLVSMFTGSIAQNDKDLVNVSGIIEQLERVLEKWDMGSGAQATELEQLTLFF